MQGARELLSVSQDCYRDIASGAWNEEESSYVVSYNSYDSFLTGNDYVALGLIGL